MINEKTFYGPEPKYSRELSQLEMIKALNWYNYLYTNKQTKLQVIKYCKSHNVAYKNIKALNDNKFINIFNLCTLVNNGAILSSTDKSFLDKKLKELENTIVEDESNVKSSPSIQDRIKNKEKDVVSQLEEYIDNKTEINFYDEFLKLNISNQLANSIINKYTEQLDEINLAINKEDEQCVECYSHLNNKELKLFRDYIKSIIDAAEQIKNRTLKIKKHRAKKPVSRDKLVAKLKYKVEDNTLKLVSINPVDILEKEKIFIYNIKSRVLSKYEAQSNFKLGVKGTTLVNFSETDSYSKKIRKPEEFFKEFKKINKEFDKTFINIKASKGVVNGRISGDCIILG